jgi:hypothetical protein
VGLSHNTNVKMLRQAQHEEKYALHPELVEGGHTPKSNFAKVLQ